MQRRLATLVLAGVATVTAAAQRPAGELTGTAAVSGVVTDARTGRPVEGAFVQLGGGSAYNIPERPRQVTDAQGRYVFTHLPPNTMYILVASKAGYLDGGYRWAPGASTGRRIELKDGQHRSDLNIQMWKPASISGTVVDERGEPVVEAPVQVLVRVQLSGRAHWAAGPTTATDDRGMYRIANLGRGEYLVQVPGVQVTLPAGASTLGVPPQTTTVGGQSGSGASAGPPALVARAADGTGAIVGHYATPGPESRGRAYPLTYHPNARSLEAATPVRLEFGDRRAGADVQLQLEPTVRISGQVVGPADALVRLPLRLLPAGNELGGAGSETGLTQADATGAFTFLNIPRGEYTIIAGRSFASYSTQSTVSQRMMRPPGGDPFAATISNWPVAGLEGVVLNMRTAAGPDAYGRLSISVGEKDITGLTLALTPTVSVSGHYLWDGSPTPPANLRLAPIVRIEPVGGDVSALPRGSRSQEITRGTGDAPLSFTIPDVRSGRYIFAPPAGTSYGFERIDFNGVNLLEEPLDVSGERPISGIVLHLTSKPAAVSGVVRSTNGSPASAAVILFPVSPTLWANTGLAAMRLRTAVAGDDGVYRITGVLPGDYYVAAVPEEDRTRVFDRASLPALSGSATRVTVAPSANIQQDLRLSGGER